jgi:general stress protein 26
MRVSTFEELQAEFLGRVSHIVYANMATIDTHDRPRSRIVHPIWEGATGWIVSWPATPKSKHLAHNPHVSLAYIKDIEKPVYVECTAEWAHDRAEKLRVWNVIKAAPPPMGFDPEPVFGTIDHIHFGLLKLTPSRVELYTLRGDPIIWQQREMQAAPGNRSGLDAN